ncbi:MAG: hypothetical protein ABI718_15825 [Acidobacteriota bacterium]
MDRNVWPAALRTVVGFLAGLACWMALSPSYARLLATLSEPLLRMSEIPAVTRLVPDGKNIVVERTDFPKRSARPELQPEDLTFNIILLMTLFAMNSSPLSTRNVSGFLAAAGILCVTHVLALFVTIKSIYALQLGHWSLAHYGYYSRSFWSGAAHFYRLIGLYAIAFGLWWLLRPPESSAGAGGSGKRKRQRKSKRTASR